MFVGSFADERSVAWWPWSTRPLSSEEKAMRTIALSRQCTSCTLTSTCFAEMCFALYAASSQHTWGGDGDGDAIGGDGGLMTGGDGDGGGGGSGGRRRRRLGSGGSGGGGGGGGAGGKRTSVAKQ